MQYKGFVWSHKCLISQSMFFSGPTIPGGQPRKTSHSEISGDVEQQCLARYPTASGYMNKIQEYHCVCAHSDLWLCPMSIESQDKPFAGSANPSLHKTSCHQSHQRTRDRKAECSLQTYIWLDRLDQRQHAGFHIQRWPRCREINRIGLIQHVWLKQKSLDGKIARF